MLKYIKNKLDKIAVVPRFWHKEHAAKSLWPDLLVPFSVIYYLIFLLKQKYTKPQKANVPIICIGNVTAGGAGKTPVAIALAEELKKITNKKICFSSRGYKGAAIGPLKVDPNIHDAKQVGDEPLLLAKALECWVGKYRLSTANAAAANGAQIVIMDDGLQNLSVIKDVNILVLDGYFGVGNTYAIPAGPLREPLDKALKKADIVVFIGEDRNNVLPSIRGKVKVTHAKTEISSPEIVEKLKKDNKKLIAFSGISIPDKFFNTLEKAGLNLIERIYFADHYNFTDKDIKELKALSKELAAELVTTEKDAIRMSEDFKKLVHIIPVKTSFENFSDIEKVLSKVL